MPRRRRMVGRPQGQAGPLQAVRLPPELLGQLKEGMKSSRVPITAPWRGYMPDLDPQLLGYNVAANCSDCVGLGDFLVPDDGFAAQGTPLPFAANQPLTLTHHFYTSIATNPATVINVACTQGYGTGSTTGHFYTQSPISSLVWVEQGFSAGTGFIGSHISAPATDSNFAQWIPDFCTYPTMGNSDGSLQGVFIFNNGSDIPYQFPDTYTTTASPSGNAAKYVGLWVGSGGSTWSSFRANSVAVFQDVFFAFNTIESSGTDIHPQRIRWGPLGGTAAGAGGNKIDFGAVGAGFIDLVNFETAGLRILPLNQNILMAYFSDGVANITATGNYAYPFARTYMTQTRGLLGKHTVCDLGGGVHFGIFNDGWYYVDYTGTWTEVGKFTGTNTQERLDHSDRILYKWKNYFYTNLNERYKNFTYCWYEPRKKFIYIAWADNSSPDGYPNRVWIYDTQGDRLWPQNYTNVGGVDVTPVCWGLFQDVLTQATVWDNAPPDLDGVPWYTLSNTPWYSLGGALGPLKLAHGPRVAGSGGGTATPFHHDFNILNNTRNGVIPTFTYQSYMLAQNAPFIIKTAKKLGVEYEQVGGTGLTLGIQTNNGANVSNFVMTTSGAQGSGQFNYMTTNVQGTHVGTSVSGAAPFKIRSMELEQVVEPIEYVRPSGVNS